MQLTTETGFCTCWIRTTYVWSYPNHRIVVVSYYLWHVWHPWCINLWLYKRDYMKVLHTYLCFPIFCYCLRSTCIKTNVHRDGCHLPCRISASGCLDMCHEPCHPCLCMWLVLCVSASCGKLQHMHCVNHTSLLWDVVWYTFCRCIYILVMMHVDACMPVTYMHKVCVF